MADIVDFVLVWCFNTMIVAAAIWTTLRAVEKALDILIKYQQYEALKKEESA